MKKHIFNAGPCILPKSALENTAKAIINFNGQGISIMEMSHRSPDFQAVMDEAVDLMKELLQVPEGYSVLFLGGGASTQFLMIPYNFLDKKAAYLNTGAWSKKALKEAKLFGEVVEVGSSADKNFNYIPKGYALPSDIDYFHITTNNTIYGTEIRTDYDCPVPLIADMSSDIMSRPVDVSKYDMIYGGAQKNLGPAGVTFIIIKDEFVGKLERQIPTMMNYDTHISKGSMFNTPPCINIFTLKETLKWVKAQGGVEVMENLAKAKADLLYNAIDESEVFEATVADHEDRSRMNVCFVMTEKYAGNEAGFMELATSKGIMGIKGHRSVGGFRASMYNALDISSVEVMVETMKEFEAKIK